MDKIGADFLYSVKSLHDRLQANARIQSNCQSVLKITSTGTIDLVTMKAEIYTNDLGTDIQETEIPEEYAEQAQEWREKIS